MGEGVDPAERPIDRALRWAKELKLGKSAFARALDVSPQTVNNWKERGMPARYHALAAKVTRHTIQELLGEVAAGEMPPDPWPFSVPRRRFDLLDEHHRHIIELLIERFALTAELKALGMDPDELEDRVAARQQRKKRRVG